jgi:hypothetical protein
LDAAGDALKIIGDAEGVDAALGIWAQEAAQVRPDWLSGLPPGAVGQITGNPQVDQPRLDEWARERTRGLIERFPVQTHAELMVILATAVALHTTWKRKFTDETVTPAAGAWAGQQLAGLQRTTRALDDLRAATTPAGVLALTTVEGDNATLPKHRDVRLLFREFAEALDGILPVGRARSVAFTELESASMWAHKSIAETAPVIRED